MKIPFRRKKGISTELDGVIEVNKAEPKPEKPEQKKKPITVKFKLRGGEEEEISNVRMLDFGSKFVEMVIDDETDHRRLLAKDDIIDVSLIGNTIREKNAKGVEWIVGIE